MIATGVLAADGFVLPELSAGLQARLRELRPNAASTSNPVDLTAVFGDMTTYPRALDLLATSGEVDATVLVGSLGTMTHEEPGRLDETEAAAAMAASGHPLVAAVQWIDEPPWRALRDGGVPAFRRVGSACRALAAAYRFASAEVRVTPGWPEPAEPVGGTSYMAARALLAAGGVPFVRGRGGVRRRRGAGGRGADRLPVALKALGAEHKSDAGGVVLGLATPAALAAAVADLRSGSIRRRSASSGCWRRRSRPSWSAA